MYRILCELLLYAIPHIILKYSPKGEGFHPSHVLEIKRAGLKVLSEKTKQEKVEVLETDELYTYVKKKSEKHGFGLLLIGKICALVRLI